MYFVRNTVPSQIKKIIPYNISFILTLQILKHQHTTIRQAKTYKYQTPNCMIMITLDFTTNGYIMLVFFEALLPVL